MKDATARIYSCAWFCRRNTGFGFWVADMTITELRRIAEARKKHIGDMAYMVMSVKQFTELLDLLDEMAGALDALPIYHTPDGTWISFRFKGSHMIGLNSISVAEQSAIVAVRELRENAIAKYNAWAEREDA